MQKLEEVLFYLYTDGKCSGKSMTHRVDMYANKQTQH